jgi:hypothetical protein
MVSQEHPGGQVVDDGGRIWAPLQYRAPKGEGQLGKRAQMLANQYEQMNEELIAVVEQCWAEQWRAVCVDENWPVGVTAHHVAVMAGLDVVLSVVARGEPWPAISMDIVHQGNARHALEHTNCTRDETTELLRRNCKAAATLIKGFDDEQLDRAWPALWRENALLSIAQCVEDHLIGHIHEHVASIPAAISS